MTPDKRHARLHRWRYRRRQVERGLFGGRTPSAQGDSVLCAILKAISTVSRQRWAERRTRELMDQREYRLEG